MREMVRYGSILAAFALLNMGIQSSLGISVFFFKSIWNITKLFFLMIFQIDLFSYPSGFADEKHPGNP
jgi:hypothetical protein